MYGTFLNKIQEYPAAFVSLYACERSEKETGPNSLAQGPNPSCAVLRLGALRIFLSPTPSSPSEQMVQTHESLILHPNLPKFVKYVCLHFGRVCKSLW